MQQPIGLKYGSLFKCSQKLKLWKSTWFVLEPQYLKYYKKPGDPPKIIDLQQPISLVAAEVDDSKRPHSFKLTSPTFPRTLIIAAESSDIADEWITAIRSIASLWAPAPEDNKGPAKLSADQKEMLQCTNDMCIHIGKLIVESSRAKSLYNKSIMDSLGKTAVLVALKGRAAVYKPKVQSGFQRFSTSVIDVQAEVVTYKRVLRNAQRKQSGKTADPAMESVTQVLTDLITVLNKTITKWMPELVDPDLTRMDMSDEGGADEYEEEEKEPSSPYISPFFINPNASPPPCRKHWDLLADECSHLVSFMESLAAKDNKDNLKLPPLSAIEQAKEFLVISRQFHETPATPNPPDETIRSVLPEDQFSLIKQQLLGSTSAIDYHAANVSFVCSESTPPHLIDIITHAQGVSSAISKLPRALRKHRARTLVSVVENIGSFALSLSKLVTQMVNHENVLRDPSRYRQIVHDEVYAMQFIAIHMLGLCPVLLSNGFQNQSDIITFTDTAKLLALSVINLLETIRFQLQAPRQGAAKRQRDSPPRKLESALKDEKTGSMVFWFGMVGQESSALLVS